MRKVYLSPLIDDIGVNKVQLIVLSIFYAWKATAKIHTYFVNEK